MEKEEKFNLVIVTGMSGSGKTQACRYMEDLGYFCVDNLPPVFIPKFAELCAHSAGHVNKVVLVVDTGLCGGFGSSTGRRRVERCTSTRLTRSGLRDW